MDVLIHPTDGAAEILGATGEIDLAVFSVAECGDIAFALECLALGAGDARPERRDRLARAAVLFRRLTGAAPHNTSAVVVTTTADLGGEG